MSDESKRKRFDAWANEPVYPVTAGNSVHSAGMRFRDHVAIQALNGLLCGRPDADCTPEEYVSDAYLYADAFIQMMADEESARVEGKPND